MITSLLDRVKFEYEVLKDAYEQVVSENVEQLKRIFELQHKIDMLSEPSELIIGQDGDSVYINGIDVTWFVKSVEDDTICLEVRRG